MFHFEEWVAWSCVMKMIIHKNFLNFCHEPLWGIRVHTSLLHVTPLFCFLAHHRTILFLFFFSGTPAFYKWHQCVSFSDTAVSLHHFPQHIGIFRNSPQHHAAIENKSLWRLSCLVLCNEDNNPKKNLELLPWTTVRHQSVNLISFCTGAYKNTKINTKKFLM